MGELVDRDLEHLRLLHIAYYVMAGLSGFVTLFSLVYISIGGAIAAGVFNSIGAQANAVLPTLGLIFVGIGICFLVVGATITFLFFLAGKSLQQRQHRTFCLVMAGLCLLQIPWGTAVGICAINVLNRDSVKQLFPELKQQPPS